MPKFLELEEIGLYRTIIGISLLLHPFSMLGSSALIQRHFKKLEKNKEILFANAFMVLFVGYFLVVTLFLIFKSQFFDFFAENAARVNDYYYVIPLLLFFIISFNFFEAYSKANLNIILPNFLRDVAYKFLTTLLILLFGFDFISFDQFVYSQIFIYAIISLILFYLIRSKYQFSGHFTDIFKKLDKDLITFSLFSFLSVAGITLVTQIDQIMVSKYLGLSLNGVYTTAVFMAVVIEYPRRFVSQISFQLLSHSYHRDNLTVVENHYKKASVNQGILGGFIFLLIVINIENIYTLMPNGDSFRDGILVLYIIGISKLIHMFFSLGSEIIAVSDHYRYNVVFAVLLGVLTVITNLSLIPAFGINGAAAATLLSFLFVDLLKFLFIKIKLGIQPFSKFTLLLILLIAGCDFIDYLLPVLDHVILDILMRTMIIAGIFSVLIYKLKISTEVNKMADDFIKKINFKF